MVRYTLGIGGWLDPVLNLEAMGTKYNVPTYKSRRTLLACSLGEFRSCTEEVTFELNRNLPG